MSSPAVYLAFLASTGLLRSILTDSGDPQDARSPLFARKSLRREAPPSVPPISEFRRQFCMSVEGAVESLEDQIGDILVQTRLEDVVIFKETTRENQAIQPEVFTHYMTLSHLPVTAITILLPDLLQNNFTLPNDFQESQLRQFQASLLAFDRDEVTKQNQTAIAIVHDVIAFVNQTLSAPQSVNQKSVRQFTNKIQGQLQSAAKFAVQDYFDTLNRSIITSNIDYETASVVIAVEGFSYQGSFLYQFYEHLLGISKSVGKNSYSPERIAFFTSPTTCNTNSTYRATLARATYASALNTLFGNNRSSPLHSLLSTAASEILNTSSSSSTPSFKGFDTVTERLYVVLIVTFLSATIVFATMILSMCYEDRYMRKEEREAKMEAKKPDKLSTEPSLLTPIAHKEFASSYSAFHQLRKKHIKSGYAHKLRAGTPSEDLDGIAGTTKYTRLLSEPESPGPVVASKELVVSRGGTTVTCTEISLEDMSES